MVTGESDGSIGFTQK